MCESREAELELAEAAFGSSFQVVNINEKETVFSLQMTSGVTLTFTIHVDYPQLPLKCLVHGAIANSKRESISQDIQKLLEDCPGLGVLSIYQAVQDHLGCNDVSSQESNCSLGDINISSIQIARFLIYFHHIMSHHKRKCLVENAMELQLGGYSKHGFPGIVVVEGLLEDVIEYVRRIQRLRWQHMVVRGEEIETIEVSLGDSIDYHRKFPEHFQEIDGSMSDLGALCRQANLHELFMTALKKTTSQG